MANHDEENYRFVVAAEDQAAAARGAQALGDTLREVEGVLEVDRHKADQDNQDLGTIVEVVATSGATLAIAQGIAAWLRARRGVTLTIEKGKAGDIKFAVKGIDPTTAQRIVVDIQKS